ncbi:MAG: signal peptidase I [Clostridiales bacterium]|nr:signal peptidase I [Clostridiales bacterium]
MEPTIPEGHMIVGKKPTSESEIEVGTVITFEVKRGDGIILVTHRVNSIAVDEKTGKTIYYTRGDNAQGVDTVHPEFSDVVGIYTGRHCGFFGYLFGFLQSSSGAIALIVIALIIVLWVAVTHYVNFLTLWKKLTAKVLGKSRQMLKDNSVEDGDQSMTVSDAIGIIIAEPKSAKDAERKRKKLEKYIEDGVLPRRPWGDDDWEYYSASPEDKKKLEKGEALTKSADENAESRTAESDTVPAAEVATTASQPLESETPQSQSEQSDLSAAIEVADKTAEAEIADETDDGEDKVEYVWEGRERVYYKRSFTAKLAQLKPDAKDRYSALKNELLSYMRVRSVMSWKRESFMLGRKAIARFIIRGKTLCILLAVDPKRYEGTKYFVQDVSDKASNAATPCLYKIRGDRKMKFAIELIADMMNALGVAKNPEYKAEDYYVPSDGTIGLMQRGLVKRVVTETKKVYRIEEISEKRALAEQNGEQPEQEAAATKNPFEGLDIRPGDRLMVMRKPDVGDGVVMLPINIPDLGITSAATDDIALELESGLKWRSYRDRVAQEEIEQAQVLRGLVENTTPMTDDDRARVKQLRAEQRKNRQKKQLTPEQREKRKAAAERKKAEEQAFLDSLSPADREVYLTEQMLKRSRESAIRRLRRINSDKKLLEKEIRN